ncbi:hypothetical protein WJU23_18515 [Prosthecobacter sp. SYSU 5D2]|uniref:hypothetical protein n=1 Tax=Prosthecobacter sp. SYSU 5D2 TaxID=3134134 RepID=UPI0031FF3AC8
MNESLFLAHERLRRSRNNILRLVSKGLIALLIFGVLLYGFLIEMSPSGVLIRKVVRENPLTAPDPVFDITRDEILTAKGSFRLAGICIPKNTSDLAAALTFLRLCTAQGIEVIRQVNPSSQMLRCEPRILHWCGNDPVEAHYEQHNLNELIVAMGYASFEDSSGLTDVERARLKAASLIAQQGKKGIWSDEPLDKERRLSKFGIRIDDVLTLQTHIRHLSKVRGAE